MLEIRSKSLNRLHSPHHKVHTYRVPQSMSPRRNWDSPAPTLACEWCNVSPSPTDVSPTDVSPTDVSPTEHSWMLHPMDKVSLGYFAPDRTIPSLKSYLIERSDT
jgi:hypothetical protein